MNRIVLAFATLLTLAPLPGVAQQQTINLGASPNDGTGDSLRTAFTKTNGNFSVLFTGLAGKAASIHTHAISDVVGLAAALSGKQPLAANLTALSAGTITGVGATPNTLAAGDDARIVGATQNASAAITSGTINGTAIGGGLPATGAFTSVSTPSLALGGSTLTGVGTGAGTVASGNDGRIVGAAQKAANLSDLASISTARLNLGAAASGANTDITSLASPSLGSPTLTTQASGDNSTKGATTGFVATAISSAGAGIPSGAVMSFAVSSCPSGWLPRNGAAVSRSANPALFSAIGTTYGAGDGSTTFNVPDDRGLFVRALDSGKGVDPNRALGSTQADAVGPITDTFNFNGNTMGSISVTGNPSGTNAYTGTLTMGDGSANGYLLKISPAGGAETRPKNIAFLGCIKT